MAGSPEKNILAAVIHQVVVKERTENEKSCCQKNKSNWNNGEPILTKPQKYILCFTVLLAVICVISFRLLGADNKLTADMSLNIYVNRSKANYDTLPFILGQFATETKSQRENAIPAEENFGEYLESLSDLNIVALKDDVALVLIPFSGNVFLDNKTKKSIYDIQRYLKRKNASVGLYTLLCDTQDYFEIVNTLTAPAFLIISKYSDMVTISGSKFDEYALLKALISCCDNISNCCI